jgi:cytochrome c oxidase accessory protein FixG
VSEGEDNIDSSDPTGALLKSPERVLSTLNADGTRRWLRPRLSLGRFLTARRAVGYFLIVLFVGLPWLRIGGKPPILLDLVRREFTLLGTTFRPTDTPLLVLLMLSLFVGIFMVTSLLGRVWCGWGCPQTVYLELVFRPLERLLEGSPQQQAKLDRDGGGARRLLKYAVFLFVSFFVANTFLAYFVGTDQLVLWMRRSPAEHPAAFLLMAGTTLLMFGDFAYFREQTCIVACPYGRFQSVLLDPSSLIVGYDGGRGEPRGKLKKLPVVDAGGQPAPRGDCIACGACVVTCPTGIDIREGLQMECIGCAQCIDACDAIMDRINKPRGLIRYTSEVGLAGGKRRTLRPRVVIYAVFLVALLTTLSTLLVQRAPARVTVLRGANQFVELQTGEVQNVLRLKIENRGESSQTYEVILESEPNGRLVVDTGQLEVAGGESNTVAVVVLLAPEAFAAGPHPTTLTVRDNAGWSAQVTYPLRGPRR